MTKICILSDLHIDYKESFIPYFKKFFDNIFFPTLEQHNVKTIIQVGDLFDNRKRVNNVCLDAFNEYFLNKFYDDYEGIFLVGNHDIPYKNTTLINSQRNLIDSNHNIRIIDTPTETEYGLCIPWICKENEEEIMKLLNTSKSSRLFGHLELSQFEMNKNHVIEHGTDPQLFKRFSKVYSGHYHTSSRKTFGKCEIIYLGTPYELTFNDCNDQKYFYILDTETNELEAFINPYKMFHKFDYNDGYDYDLSSITDGYVRVNIKSKKDLVKYDMFIQELESYSPVDYKLIETIVQYDNSIELDIDNIDITDTVSIMNQYIDESEQEVEKSDLKELLRDLYNVSISMSSE